MQQQNKRCAREERECAGHCLRWRYSVTNSDASAHKEDGEKGKNTLQEEGRQRQRDEDEKDAMITVF